MTPLLREKTSLLGEDRWLEVRGWVTVKLGMAGV